MKLGFCGLGQTPAVGEALALADSLGLDYETTIDVLAESPVGATIARKRPAFESGR